MLLTPEVVFRRVEAITPEVLRRMGITALVLDVDNTLTGDGSQQAGRQRRGLACGHARRRRSV